MTLVDDIKNRMQLIPLETSQQLRDISAAEKPQAILKHNTTCSISMGVLARLRENNTAVDGIGAFYVLDLLANRELSDAIVNRFGVPHQSPQVLVIQDGRCIYHEWGYDISAQEIAFSVKPNS